MCFFKQKTAYEMLRSLVGSEMCIRDSALTKRFKKFDFPYVTYRFEDMGHEMAVLPMQHYHCLLYTSDAADDLLCVDLGGRRIIKKKSRRNIMCSYIYHAQQRNTTGIVSSSC